MSILMYKQRHKPPNHIKTPKCNYAHIGYIATRPGASKNEGMRHGLFGKLTPSGEITEFETWQEVGRLVREMSYRRVNIFRGIISFAPDTAKELGLTDHRAWEAYIEQHIKTLAEKNGIRPQDLQWAAAHHNERSHPHIHIVFWNKNQRTMIPYVSPKIPDSIRVQLIKDTFPEKIQAFLAEKDKAKGSLTAITDDVVSAFDEYMKKLHPKAYRQFMEQFGKIDVDELCVSPLDGVIGKADLAALIPRLFALKEKMPKKGRLYYKLLPEDVKAELVAFVREIKDQSEYVRQLVEEYADSKCRLAMLYDTNPDNLADHRKNAIAEADRLIANKVLRILKTMLTKERETVAFEYNEARKAYYAEEVLCEILMLLEQAVISLDEDYEVKAKAMGTELSKAALKEWYLRHKDKGIEP